MAEIPFSILAEEQHRVISGIDLSKLRISEGLSRDAQNGDPVAIAVLRRIQAAKRQAALKKLSALADSSSGWL